MNIEIVTRATALSQGLARYFTGKPCKHGHVFQRFTQNGTCLGCEPNIAARTYQNNREAIRARCKIYYEENKSEVVARAESWRKQNPSRAKTHRKTYKSRNKGKTNAASIARRLSKIKRTPKWAELDAIKEIYIACPPDCHVDHIIPLQGELVSGLHVLGNLQYLPIKENLSKGNKFDPTL